jgi:hypothetical protein
LRFIKSIEFIKESCVDWMLFPSCFVESGYGVKWL